MSTTAAVTAPRGLNARDSALLELCYQHRLLTTRQVHLLAYPAEVRRTAQKALARLAGGGFVACGARQAAEEAVWFVTETGAAIVETGKVDVRRHRMTADLAGGVLRDHTLEVNETGLAFVTAARARARDECGPGAWQHEIGFRVTDRQARGRLGADICPDAVLEYTISEGGRHEVVARFIEVDRGTEPSGRFATKLRVYVELHDFKPKYTSGPPTPHGYGWESRFLVFPKVLVVLCDHPDGPDTAALARRREKLLGMCALDPVLERARLAGQVVITFTTLAELVAQGPFAPIFWSPGAEGPADLVGESALPAQLTVPGVDTAAIGDGRRPVRARREATPRDRRPGERWASQGAQLALVGDVEVKP